MRYEIPTPELLSVLKTIQPIASLKAGPTDVCIDNIKLSFNCGKIFATAVKNPAQFSAYADWDETPPELDNQSFSIPYDETLKLLSGNLDKMQVFIEIENDIQRIIFLDGKSEIKFQLESVVFFPKEKEPSMDILWTIPGEDVKELLSSKIMGATGSLYPMYETLFLFLESDVFTSLLYNHTHVTFIRVGNSGKGNDDIIRIPVQITKALLEQISDEMDVYISKDENTTISSMNWSMVVNAIDFNFDRKFIMDGLKNVKSQNPIAIVVVSKSAMMKAVNMYNTVGYVSVNDPLQERKVRLVVSPSGAFLVNDMSSYGINANIEIEGANVTGSADVKFGYDTIRKALSLAHLNAQFFIYDKKMIVLTDKSETFMMLANE